MEKERWKEKVGDAEGDKKGDKTAAFLSRGAPSLLGLPDLTQPAWDSSAMQIPHPTPVQAHKSTHTHILSLFRTKQASLWSNCLLPVLAISIVSGRVLRVVAQLAIHASTPSGI